MHTIVNIRLSCVGIEVDKDLVCKASRYLLGGMFALFGLCSFLLILSQCMHYENMLVQRASYMVIKYFCAVIVLTSLTCWLAG